MSETTTTDAVTADPTNVPVQGDPADLGDNGKKALEAERRQRAAAEKQAKSLQAQLDEIAKANLSDLEKAQKSAQEYQQAAEKATTDALRWRIAARHGISDDDAETFLTGVDEASLTRQAERLVALAQAPTTPRPDPSQGARAGATALNGDGLESALRDKLGI